MKISIRKIISIIDLHKTLLEGGTKLDIAYNVYNRSKINKILDEYYNEPNALKRLDLCLVDKDGGVIYDENKEYKFNKESIKELNLYNKALLEKEVEIDFFTVDFHKLSEKQKSVIALKDENSGNYFLKPVNSELFEILSLFITNIPNLEQIND